MGLSFRQFMMVALMPAIVIVDQITKHMVLAEPRFRAMECLNDGRLCGQIELSSIFDLSMVWNRGVSFGTLQSEGIMRWVLVVMTVCVAIGFAVWLLRATRQMTMFALALVVSGAAGNVIDRVRFGAVVDFFDFSGLYFPYVFNVADAAISIGAALLFLDQFLVSREAAKAAKTENQS